VFIPSSVANGGEVICIGSKSYEELLSDMLACGDAAGVNARVDPGIIGEGKRLAREEVEDSAETGLGLRRASWYAGIERDDAPTPS
jgi:hypothetical protein